MKLAAILLLFLRTTCLLAEDAKSLSDPESLSNLSVSELNAKYSVAVRKGASGAMIKLICAGADPSIVVDGRSALFWATQHDECDLLNVLIEKRYPLDKMDVGETSTPLVRAAALTRGLCPLGQLLQAGCDVNAGDAFGQTALQMALRRRDHAKVNFLLARGADANKPDLHGTLPIMYRRAIPEHTYRLLKKHGARPVDEADFNVKVLMVGLETRVLEAQMDMFAIENGKTSTQVIEAKDLHEYMEYEGVCELVDSGFLDPFGNPYVFSAWVDGVKINPKTITAITEKLGGLPEHIGFLVPEK